MAFAERESEILRAIRILAEARLDFIVVGGYAVSALSRHRFSADCDLVIPKQRLGRFEQILTEEGFAKGVEKAGFDDTYAGEFVRFTKEVAGLPVAVDLLVNSLVCRSTEAAWSYDYIMKHSTLARMFGLESSLSCRIPERELLIAFKIHSGRKADVRDVVMLAEDVDPNKVFDHLRRGRTDALRRQVDGMLAALDDQRLVDSLKGVFTMDKDVARQIEKARRAIESLRRSL